jgi:hypothetical protein
MLRGGRASPVPDRCNPSAPFLTTALFSSLAPCAGAAALKALKEVAAAHAGAEAERAAAAGVHAEALAKVKAAAADSVRAAMR